MKLFSKRTLPIQLICAALITILSLVITSATGAATTVYYVNPNNGSDSANGQSANSAFLSIQHAMNLAQAGDTIQLAAGIYQQDLVSQRDGLEDMPITIIGPADAIITGAGAARIFEIRHDHLTLQGFTLDGKYGPGDKADDYRDKLLYVIGSQPGDGVQGLRILKMNFLNAGGECLRLRYYAQNNEIADSNFQNCGVHDFRFNAGGKNGEGIYIGTAPEQLNDGKNPTNDADQSQANWVHHNSFDTQGNECVDIKEAATANIIEYNICTGQLDPNSAGFDSRGNGNIFRYNESYDNIGAGVRLGGDTPADGVDNEVYGNILRNNAAGGIRFQRDPQRLICENSVEGSAGAAGNYAKNYDVSAPCPPEIPSIPSQPIPRTPSPTPSAQAPPPPTPTQLMQPSQPDSGTPTPLQPARQCNLFSVGETAERIESEMANQHGSHFLEIYDPNRSNGVALVTAQQQPLPANPAPSAQQDYIVFLPNIHNTLNGIEFEVFVEQSSSVTLWILGFGEDSKSDSFSLQIDNGKQRTVTVSRNTWEWRKITSVDLAQGSHQLLLSEREPGAAIDAIAFTRGKASPAQAVAAPCR